jgi:hypothetical protein
MSKFKVGDRIVITPGKTAKEPFEGQRGVVLYIKGSFYEIKFDNEITWNGSSKQVWTGGGNSAVLESVYNSPLYQALL